MITLNHGAGGKEMHQLLGKIVPRFSQPSLWQNKSNDSATLEIDNGEHLCFTTDTYTVSPYEFPGGNMGTLAFCGTINDLVVMGADPLGLSLSLVIEEGFSESKLETIIKTIANLSEKYKVPIVTGDTKVMEGGKIDQIIINTSGVGMTKEPIMQKIEPGDKVIVSGAIGEHGTALLSKRFEFQTDLITDAKPLIEEMKAIRPWIKAAKDPTRGGLASALNEIAQAQRVEIEIEEKKIPISPSVKTATGLLGIDPLALANEGRLIIICSPEKAEMTEEKLRKFNSQAQIIGQIQSQNSAGKVFLKTEFHTRLLPLPSGKIVPRIC